MTSVQAVLSDLETLKSRLSGLPVKWDGRECILQMKERDYHWRQMEWIGFYGQMLAEDLLRGSMSIPGERYGNAEFDVSGAINWDIKVHPTTTNASILNDVEATDLSIQENGVHGLVMIAVDALYDETGEFKAWHDVLKGGTSRYEADRIERGARSRRRKVSAQVKEINFVLLDEDNITRLGRAQEGWRNSNGAPRRAKYQITKAKLAALRSDQLVF